MIIKIICWSIIGNIINLNGEEIIQIINVLFLEIGNEFIHLGKRNLLPSK